MAEKKKVRLAPGTKVKEDVDSKSSISKSSKRVSLSKELNPIQRSKESIKRSYDVRRTRENFGDKIKNIEDEYENDVRYLLDQINYYRKDNEKLLRQQTLKFGRTLDDMTGVKDELEIARRTNDELYHEVEDRKEECDKLQIEMESLLERINALTIEKSDLLHDKRIYKEETAQLEEAEFKVQDLLESNRYLRSLLIKNKIDPKTDASTIKTETKIKMPTPPTARTYHEYSNTKLPLIFNRKNLLSFRSMEDVSQSRRTGPAKHGKLKRSHSYSQQPLRTRINSQTFMERRLSDALTRTHNRKLHMFV